MQPIDAAPDTDSSNTSINFDALRNAPSESSYKNSLTDSYYALLHTYGRKMMIAVSILAIPLLFAGQFTIIIVVIISWFAYRESLRHRIKITIEQTQLGTFARDNGWQFATTTSSVSRPGSLFENGAPCMIENHLITPTFEVGRSVFVHERDNTLSVYRIRNFVGLYLPKTLPHLLVNAKKNKNDIVMSWLPHLGDDVRKISLEGDFDHYFTLYAPRKYDTDARVIFSPDVMSVLIDDAKSYDMEIIGNRMYFYCDTIDWLDEAFWQRANNLAMVIEKEVGHQAIHYTDEHKDKELEVAQKGMGLQMIISLPLWAKLWIGGIIVCMSLLGALIVLFPRF